MEIACDNLDEVLIDLYKALLTKPGRNDSGTRGANTEMLGVALRISNPRARISRSEDRGKPFSAIGELLWYLSKSDKLEFIKAYIPKYESDAANGVLPGAYGPRLFAMRGSIDQIANVIKLLEMRSGTRRAVIQFFNAEDIVDSYSEIPCTTTLQFHIRESLMHMSVTMRSNDAYWGLPHDVFCFTMIQEMMARRLKIGLGEYYHYAASMHVYDNKIESMERYVAEGHQRTIEMPPMPEGNPFELVPTLIAAENRIRHRQTVVAGQMFQSGYWADIVRLIQVFWAKGEEKKLNELSAEFNNPDYRVFLDGRRSKKIKDQVIPIDKVDET